MEDYRVGLVVLKETIRKRVFPSFLFLNEAYSTDIMILFFFNRPKFCKENIAMKIEFQIRDE